jgi:hypothetical protein
MNTTNKTNTPTPDIPRRWEVVRKAYGRALFELAECLRAHEMDGPGYPTVKEVQRDPMLFDGTLGDEGCLTDAVISTYFALLQTERRLDPKRCNNDDPIDQLVQVFGEWTDWWLKWQLKWESSAKEPAVAAPLNFPSKAGVARKAYGMALFELTSISRATKHAAVSIRPLKRCRRTHCCTMDESSTTISPMASSPPTWRCSRPNGARTPNAATTTIPSTGWCKCLGSGPTGGSSGI